MLQVYHIFDIEHILFTTKLCRKCFFTSVISKILYCTLITTGRVIEKKFERDTINAMQVNEEILLKILKRNSESEIGEKYNFSKIKSIKDYIECVPISEYCDYEKYINRMCKGEKNIIVSEEIEYFGHTSGTTGKQKLIPVTKSGRVAASKYMAVLSQKFTYNNFKDNFNYGKGLMIADTVTTTYTEAGIPICSATSGGMKKIKKVIPYMYTSPYEVMEVKDKEVGLYLHLLFALKEIKLSYISGIFISNILDLLRVLEEKRELLVRDIRKGKIDKRLNIDEEIRKKLNSYIKPDAFRADTLEKEFNKGLEGICKRIWPDITYIACVTGANFSIYDDKVNYYTKNLPIYSTAYAATEAMIGINPYLEKIRYVIIPDTVFYEFISIQEQNKKYPKTYLINELKVGEKYEIVVTNHAGLYRYKLGDVIKVVGFYNSSPEVEFLYRKNQVLNMVSEKTTEEHLTNSIRNAMKKLNVSLVDYTTFEDNSISPGRYVFYFEIKDNLSKEKFDRLQNTLDLELQNANVAYGRFRKNNRLERLEIKLVKKDTFNFIKESLITKGVSKSQIKIPRVISNKREILKILNSKTI